ncbi:hypothetical protein KHM83_01275 [Fusibacter paucivorans]|uniref:4-vinyl reductase 4VR domain-containing protein n=1 Tax=Fusibacter paucivorans TaxID=76009 RepID=A0ABS5PL48_9FIRM|nr:hypothetical protein [Fusibacter paucivorans]MBS7525301.1 hypothetical protein [Fusibacter paucivorans]
MSEHIDERMPREVGKGALPDHPGIKTPWDRIFSFHDTYKNLVRHIAVVDTSFMEAMRILIPDYVERSKMMCEINHKILRGMFGMDMVRNGAAISQNFHPFMKGVFLGGLIGDVGDERQYMPGRVNDFGTYRVEKELDVCPWDILGSEFCRATTATLQAAGESYGGHHLEYNMVEAKGCGDLHCRVIAESREKFPMADKESWEKFGPIATSDQIKFTPEENMVTKPQQFREECDYKMRNGLNTEWSAADLYNSTLINPLGVTYVVPVLEAKIAAGVYTREYVQSVVECVCRGAGKAMFGEYFAIKGLRDWMGVPNDVDDGRVLGGYIEVVLQTILCQYEVVAFNKNEVIYDINQAGLERRVPMLTPAYIAMWYGMCKTLVGSLWSVWRETENVPEGTIRLKIAKKIDKFCL